MWRSSCNHRDGVSVQSFRATVKGLKSDEDLETTVTLRVPGLDYDKVSPIGKRTKQVLVIMVFSEDEFLQWKGSIKEIADDES